MKLQYFKYFSVYLVPLIVVFSIYQAGYFSFSALVFVFGLIPLIELFTKGSTENMNEVEEAIAAEDRFYDYVLYGLVPFQCFVLFFFLYHVADSSLQWYETVGLITAYGMACGIAINTAHELGHRDTRYEQLMSKALLMTSLYMHFFIEHNRGHHLNVATEEDPASSRYGENIYAFYLRTISGSWLSAWKLEEKRLTKAGRRFWSWNNEMLRFQLIQLFLLVIIGVLFGWKVLIYFCLGAFIGMMLLETVNYIEHYGLQRRKRGKRYERTLPIHSWNSNHPLGRLLLLELSRHSDHHFIANRKYQLLRHFDESPQMPTGYPGMMLLALIPPIWFKVMHTRIDHYRSLTQGEALA